MLLTVVIMMNMCFVECLQHKDKERRGEGADVLLAPTDALMFFANGEHEGHEFFFSQQIFIVNGEHEEHEVFIWSTDYTDYTEN